MLLIIDSDSLCYGFAFAQEKKGVVAHKHSGRFMKADMNKAIQAMVKDTGATDYKVYLTGEGNFRNAVSGTYKANRANMAKPVLLKEARQHLVDNHHAIVSEGMEADDLVCIEMTELNDMDIPCMIAAIDKDIMQCPGQHYRWPLRGKPSVFTTVSEHDGLMNLYTQALEGDRVDNIMMYLNEEKGTWQKDYGYGKKTIRKVLADCVTEKDFQQTVLDHYATFTKKSDGTTPTVDDFITNMNLLYLLRSEDDSWKLLNNFY